MSVQETIELKIVDAIKISGLEVLNESHMHNVPPGSESHFKVIIISDDFVGQSLVKRHQKINELLAYELSNGVHALSIQAMTAEEWTKKGEKVMPSPKCLGGGKGQSH